MVVAEAGITGLRAVVAEGIYARGLVATAEELDMWPSNLCVALADAPQGGRRLRRFDADELERYIERTGDKTPIYCLIARYLGDEGAARDNALEQVADLLQNLPAMLAAAGLQQPVARRRR